MIKKFKQIRTMARSEFADIVTNSQIIHRRASGSDKLRLFFKDQTFMDIWLSESGKFSYHWEHRAKRGLLHRHDNAPDHPEIETFPKHFHNGDEKNVSPSYLNDEPLNALREFLKFVRKFIIEH